MHLTTAMSENPGSQWTRNGYRYWQLKTADAEIVASIPVGYTPHHPPMHAKYELYSIKKGLAKFLGYLEGEQLARAHRCFSQAFAR
jgi:hypothetical protein